MIEVLVVLVVVFASVLFDDCLRGVFTMRKVGGLRFVRIGRLQMSFCVCRN